MYIYFHGTWSPGTTTGDNSRRQGVKVASVYPCIRDPLSTNHETSHCDDERGSSTVRPRLPVPPFSAALRPQRSCGLLGTGSPGTSTSSLIIKNSSSLYKAQIRVRRDYSKRIYARTHRHPHTQEHADHNKFMHNLKHLRSKHKKVRTNAYLF